MKTALHDNKTYEKVIQNTNTTHGADLLAAV